MAFSSRRRSFTLIELITRLRLSHFVSRDFAERERMIQHHKRRGFTLIELIIVVAIIAIVVSAVFVAIDPVKRLSDARESRAMSDAEMIDKAIELYLTDRATHPNLINPPVDFGAFSFSPSGGKAPICAEGQSADGSCVSIQQLVNTGYLSSVPEIDDASLPVAESGFEYAYLDTSGTYAGNVVIEETLFASASSSAGSSVSSSSGGGSSSSSVASSSSSVNSSSSSAISSSSSPPLPSRTFYVDATNGVDTTGCAAHASETNAWKTLTKVNACVGTFVAGDQILFKRGETFSGQLYFPASSNHGIAGNPIVFGAYGTATERPIISASGQQNTVDIRGHNYITVRDIIAQNGASRCAALSSNAQHITYTNVLFRSCPTGLEIISGANSNILIENSRFESASNGFASNVALQFLTIRSTDFVGQTTQAVNLLALAATTVSDIVIDNVSVSGRGMVLTKVSSGIMNNVTVRNSDVTGAVLGLVVAANNTLIENSSFNGNTSDGLRVQGSNGVTVRNTMTNGNGADGIGIRSSSSNVLIENFTSNSNALDGVDLDNVTTAIVRNGTTNSNVGNGVQLTAVGNDALIENIGSALNGNDGFGVSGTTSSVWTNVVFHRCTAVANGTATVPPGGDGFSFHRGSGIIRRSMAINNRKSGIAHVGDAVVAHESNVFVNDATFTASPAYIGMAYASQTTQLSFSNNTFYSATRQATALSVGDTSSVTANGNIVTGFSAGFSRGSTSTLTNSYNLFYDNAADFAGSAAAGVGSILSPANQNPLFVNPAGSDFHLQATSPAIDSGTAAGFATDYDGNPRAVDKSAIANTGTGTPDYVDRGAFEVQ